MSKQQKTKQGMASIYIVVFVTMLIGVITLSFLRIMLSESGRTEKSTLADSALNSALAGVEDAKSILMAYHSCDPADRSGECTRAREAISATKESDNCDLFKGDTGEQNVGINEDSGEITDQAYTCVNLTIRGNFVGAITKERPILVVPMRIEDPSKIGTIKGVKLRWSSSKGNGGTTSISTLSGDYNKSVNDKRSSGVLGENGVVYSDGTDNTRAQNGLKVTLIQSDASYSINSFYSAAGEDNTNRGTLMLLPSSDAGAFESIDSKEFAKSADKTYNSPIAVKCDEDPNAECSVKLNFPDPASGARIQDTFFLVISGVYSEPNIDNVTITMFDDAGDVDFFDVQPIVDSTGRAGDMMRRVEVRLNPDYAALVPLSELTVDGDLNKNFFVTKNCINDTSECH